ncbi:hypothetical protein Vretimale_10190, partial [Volvox reticuliferus]
YVRSHRCRCWAFGWPFFVASASVFPIGSTMSQIATGKAGLEQLISKATERILALETKPEVVAILKKLEDDLGAILSVEETRIHDAYQKALEAKVELECKLNLVKSATITTGKRTFPELNFYKCQFGADEGKPNKSLLRQKETLSKLHEHHQRVKAAMQDYSNAEEDERPEKMQRVEEAITTGGKAFDEAAKALVVAFNHGWDVVRRLEGAAYASSEKEQKGGD